MQSAEERLTYQKNPQLLNVANFAPRVADVVPNHKSQSPPKMKDLKNSRKFNSTATVFAKTTINAPDVKEIIECFAKALYWNIKDNENKPLDRRRFNDVFSEEKHPLGDGNTDLCEPPELESIKHFLDIVFSSQTLSPECGVMATAYIERLIRLTGLTLHASNWRRVVIGSLLLASKVWEDLAVWNVDFIDGTFHNLSVKDLNMLEREFLTSLQFTVTLKASVYAKYYFQLRALSDVDDDNFPVRPLDREGAELLEARSKGLEEAKKGSLAHDKRALSLNPYQGRKETAVGLSVEEIQKKHSTKHDDD